jgi:hypothetical protein
VSRVNNKELNPYREIAFVPFTNRFHLVDGKGHFVHRRDDSGQPGHATLEEAITEREAYEKERKR